MGEPPRGRRVHFRRTGGLVAFKPLETSVAIDDEPGEDAAELARLLDEADVPGLAQQSPAPGPGADQFEYQLTVEREGERHEIALGQSQVPGDLRPLIKRLERRAMEERRRR